MISVEEPHVESSSSPAGEIRHGVRQLARDVVTLTELQAELLKVDMRDWLRTSLVPAVAFGAAAVVFVLASVLVLLVALGFYLAEATELTTAAAMLLAAGVGAAVALLCGILTWRVMKRSGGTFARFRTELVRNINWLKQVLGSPGS